MEHFSIIKNEIMRFAGKWMEIGKEIMNEVI